MQNELIKDYLRTAGLVNMQTYPEPTSEEIKEMIGLIETRLEYKPINRIKNAGVKEGYLKVLEILRNPEIQKEAVSAIKNGETVVYQFDDMKTAQSRAIASMALDYLAGKLGKEVLIGVPVKD